jgi:5-formyltetrahydrofolate cyclo-ligase
MPNDKSVLRNEAASRRDALPADVRSAASRAVAAGVVAVLGGRPPGIVAGYMPIRSEIDPRPAMRELAGRGFSFALPRIEGDDIVFRAWRFDGRLVRGPFGILEPEASAPEIRPSALLVPMAAFDRSGHRIGYGRGFYDRAAARLALVAPPTTVGLAFSVQEVRSVPAETHDRALDWIVTEREVIRIEKSENPDAPSLSR